jgi:hypothetical protein
MNFCCPNLLGESGQFHENFSMPIERARYRGASAQLIKESIEASEVNTFCTTYRQNNFYFSGWYKYPEQA